MNEDVVKFHNRAARKLSRAEVLAKALDQMLLDAGPGVICVAVRADIAREIVSELMGKAADE